MTGQSNNSPGSFQWNQDYYLTTPPIPKMSHQKRIQKRIPLQNPTTSQKFLNLKIWCSNVTTLPQHSLNVLVQCQGESNKFSHHQNIYKNITSKNNAHSTIYPDSKYCTIPGIAFQSTNKPPLMNTNCT